MSDTNQEIIIALEKFIELVEAEGKRHSPVYTQIFGYIPKDLASKFRKICRERKIEHSTVIEKLLSEWVETN